MTDEKTQIRETGSGDTEAALAALEYAADMLKIPQIGGIIGERYRVTEQLGSGAYGWVFGVQHVQLGQKFALKILIPRVAADPKWVARFREEAKATSLIGHENIVFVTDFGSDREYGEFLVMEYLNGMSLADLLLREPVQPLDRTLRFIIDAGSALSAVHELGIVHCDLKPSNVFMIRQDGRHERWKLIDFGTSSTVIEAVESDRVFGTPRYMAPEQAAGRPLDHRADQFSLASIVYEMLTGKSPWQIEEWADAMPAARSKNAVVPPSSLSEHCPVSLDEVLLRALSVKPHKRFDSMETFTEMVQSCVEADVVPSGDPFDAVESQGFKRSFTAPKVDMLDMAKTKSVRVDLENIETEKPTILVTYTNAARLRREYRRNLIAGRLFVPSEFGVPGGTELIVELGYEPNSTFVRLHGTVISTDDTHGFGVRVNDESRRPLRKFLTAVRLGFGFLQNDVLVRSSLPTPPSLSAAQAFVLSKLGTESTVGRLRGQLNGLPLGFEETVCGLIEYGLVQLHQGGAGDSSSMFVEDSVSELADESTVFDRNLSPSEVNQILENVVVFKEQQNYLAAISILENATEIASSVAQFHYELGKLLHEFVGDEKRAKREIDHAVLLAPENQTYRGFRSKLP